MKKHKIAVGEIGELITSDDVLGKDVIDADGEFIGIAESLYLNQKTLDFAGISIDKGFLKKGLIIGKDYISKVTDYAVFINVTPAFNIKGMTVFDSEGNKIGKVKEIKLIGNKNELEELIVDTGLLRKEIKIKNAQIKRIGENVILKIKKEELVMA